MSHVASWQLRTTKGQCGDSVGSSMHHFSWLPFGWGGGLRAVFFLLGGQKQATWRPMDFWTWTSHSERSPAWPRVPAGCKSHQLS